MIVEGLATTWDSEGRINVAPLGPIVPDSPPTEWTELLFRPFPGSRTYGNLLEMREGVFHLTDDAFLIAKSAIGDAKPSLVPCEVLRGFRLLDCCRAFEFRIVEWYESGERPEAFAEIVWQVEGRPWKGFNRAKHAVLEAAILATRLHLLGKAAVEAEYSKLKSPIDKTAGSVEQEAFQMLQDYVRDWKED